MDVEQFHNLIWYLISAIEDHATPRDYDWLVLKIAAAGTIIAMVSTFYAVRLYKGQMKIIREQNAISKQENDIALFDKQHELLKEINSLKDNMSRTRRFFDEEAIFSERNTKILNEMKGEGKNPIFLKSKEFISREVNSFVSLFAANVLIHRMSNEYIEFRRKNENGDTSVSDVIFFLDKVNIEVEAFSSRLGMMGFVFDLSDDDISELKALGCCIENIKFFRDENDMDEDGINRLKEVLSNFCKKVDSMKITNTLNEELKNMKKRVKQQDDKPKDSEKTLTIFQSFYIDPQFKKRYITFRKKKRRYLRNPFIIRKGKNCITISIQNPYMKTEFENEQKHDSTAK